LETGQCPDPKLGYASNQSRTGGTARRVGSRIRDRAGAEWPADHADVRGRF
jgi:hypothetical protein